MASTADCVLIFVESPGSFAETGLFAALKKIRKKTFVVNTRKQSQKDSFLNQGPIRLIYKKSDFDKVHCLDGETVTPQDANDILQFILKNCTKYKNSLVFHPEHKFTDLELRLQLASVYMAVTLLWAATAALTTAVLRKRFADVDAARIERYLSLLKSIDVVGRHDEIYFTTSTKPFINDFLISSIDFLLDEVRAKTLNWHAENNSQVAVFLREQRGVGI